jgi:hypothetical protein
MKISLLTHTDTTFKPVSDITIPIFKEYCDRHNYDFFCRTEHTSGRHIVWEKIALILDYFENKRDAFDWLCYCDADAMIMNHTIRLENFIDDNVDFIGTNDCHGYNAGVFFLKNSDWSFDFIKRVWEVNPHDPILRGRYNDTQAEQLAIVSAMKKSKGGHVKIVQQSLFNAFPYYHWNINYPEGDFKEGDFILHLPGMNTQERVDYLNKYKGLIIR